MGYAGYVPAKLAPGKPTEFQSTLWSIKELATLEIIHKLSYNTAIAPADDKFRKVKLSNAKIRTTIVDVPGALDTMLLLGWQQAEEEGEAVLLLPKGTNITMAQVRAIQDAQERLKKDARSMSRSSSASSIHSSKSTKDLEALRAQLEADKAERAAREPVTAALKAQALPGAGGSGPNIAGGKDAGFKHGCDC